MLTQDQIKSLRKGDKLIHADRKMPKCPVVDTGPTVVYLMIPRKTAVALTDVTSAILSEDNVDHLMIDEFVSVERATKRPSTRSLIQAIEDKVQARMAEIAAREARTAKPRKRAAKRPAREA